MTTPDDLITTQEAAKLLGRSPRTLEKWRRRPTKLQPLSFWFDGIRCWYSKEEVTKYRDSQMWQKKGKAA